MGIFFIYILKSSVCLALFYLFYRLLLSRETFHRFNRIAILSILFISLLIPFCEVTIEQQTEVQQTVLSLEQILLLANTLGEANTSAQDHATAVWIQVVLITYIVGVLFFICRSLYSLARLCLMLRKGERKKLDNGKILVVHQQSSLSPFSWMKYVVISAKDLEENGREILIHELAHIRNKHSIDLLLADICIFFQWFNPAAWLLKQELQNIHEYEADETVIQEGIDAKQYQLLLIKKAVGTRLYSMANSFNHSKLKKRITMMLKEKSSPWARLKYLYVLPLAAVAITAFARPEITKELEEISAVKVNDLAAIIETKTTEKSEAGKEVNDGVKKEKPQKKETQIELELTIETDSASNIINGGHTNYLIQLDGAELGEPGDTLVGKIISTKKVNDKVVITSKSESGAIVTINKKGEGHSPLFIVNGKEVDQDIVNSIAPDFIKNITVLKDESAINIYGEKGKNGVVIMEIKRMVEKPLQSKPLIIVDGKVVDRQEDIDPSTIESISVIKHIDKAGTAEERALFEKYAERAADGLILIYSKKKEGEE